MMNEFEYHREVRETIIRHHDKDYFRKLDAAMAERSWNLDRRLDLGRRLAPELLLLIEEVKQSSEKRFWRLNRIGLAQEFKTECERMTERIAPDAYLPEDFRLKAPPTIRTWVIDNPKIESWLVALYLDIEERIYVAEAKRFEAGPSKFGQRGLNVLALRQLYPRLGFLMKIFDRYTSLGRRFS